MTLWTEQIPDATDFVDLLAADRRAVDGQVPAARDSAADGRPPLATSAVAAAGARTDGSAEPAAASRWRRAFAFPNPVNEYAARCTAGVVVVLALAALFSGQGWALVAIAAGFVLRLLFGPRISPAALLSVKVLAPRFGAPKLVPGPPKRFAQGIGTALSVTAASLFFAGVPAAAWALTAVLIVAASLESFAGLCLGCVAFGLLQRAGIIPASVCEACNNFSLRSR